MEMRICLGNPMGFLRLIFTFVFVCLGFNTMAKSDAELYDSSAMNATPGVQSSTQNEGGIRVVFIGNSITLHGKAPKIGWNNEWGMAASAADKDYVHLVTAELEKRTGRKADVRVRNLAEFERGYGTYDLARLKDLVDFQPDYLIVALGENVGNLEGQERADFRDAFKRLLGSFLVGPHKPHAVVRGCFWPNAWKDELMAQAARECGIPFVKADVSPDDSMRAVGLFEHPGVQNHPGDKGMAEIARRIIQGLFPDKPSSSQE